MAQGCSTIFEKSFKMTVINWQPKDNTLFISIVDTVDNNIFSVDFAKLLPKSCIIVQPNISAKAQWNDVADWMQYIPNDLLYGDNIILFDSSAEAMCPVNEFHYWRSINYNCKKHNVNPKRIIYLSSNLQDKFTAQKRRVKFWVYTEIFWQNYCLAQWQLDKDVDSAFEASAQKTIKMHNKKYFSSLNKNNQRPARSYLNWCLWQKGLTSVGLVSQNFVPQDQQKYFEEFYVSDFNHVLPMHIDRFSYTTGDNAHTDWIFDSTIFAITQESSQSVDHEKTLVSEKYFKPIANFTPQLVYGDLGINRLYTIAQGFKTYSQYFKLNLGTNWHERAHNIVAQTNDICQQLDRMTHSQRIDWKYKDEATLKHNYRVMLTNQFNTAQRQEFLRVFNI
jgi:hypothetical protein